MFKRFWNAVKSYNVCLGFHNIQPKSPVCSRCGYNIEIPIQKQKDRSKSRGKKR